MRSKLKKSEFARNSIVLMVGIALAQLIPILLQPLLRRMYEPEDFGLFAIYFGLVSILGLAANLRYSHVVVIPKEDEKAKAVVAGALVVAAIMSILFSFIYWWWDEEIIQWADWPTELLRFSYLIPLSVFFISGSLILNYWLTRKKQFKAIASNKLYRRGAEGVGHLSLGAYLSSGGLVVGTLIGDCTNFFVSLVQAKKAELSFKGVERREIKSLLKKYWRFPVYNLMPTLLDTVSLFLPVLIVSSYYSEQVTGQFDLSRQILALPLALISAALSQVLMQKIAEQRNLGKPILPLLMKNAKYLLVLSLAAIIVLYFFSVEIFSFVFGEKWMQAGEFTSILVFSYAARFVVAPLSIMFIVTERLKISSLWQVSYFAAICILFTYKEITIEDFILYYTVIDAVMYVIYFGLIWFTAKFVDKNVSKV